MGKAEGIINDEIPNCWECPKCHKEGKTSKVRLRAENRTTEALNRDSLYANWLNNMKIKNLSFYYYLSVHQLFNHKRTPNRKDLHEQISFHRQMNVRSSLYLSVSIQDQADGSGKRRLDNGEVGRWKLTDDPPPKKKAPPSLEEGGRMDGGHKRKKEKELPQDSGAKKKVREVDLEEELLE